MAIHRHPEPILRSTVYPNKLLHDADLSLEALGLLVYTLSFSPRIVFTSFSLAEAALIKEDRDTILATLFELEKAGYAVRGKPNYDGTGCFTGHDWSFTDVKHETHHANS